jgi:hypothetical protein
MLSAKFSCKKQNYVGRATTTRRRLRSMQLELLVQFEAPSTSASMKMMSEFAAPRVPNDGVGRSVLELGPLSRFRMSERLDIDIGARNESF